VAVINSWGVLEIAVCRGSAQKRAQADLGDKVRVANRS
jgi:S-adenosylmethionine hydrolase